MSISKHPRIERAVIMAGGTGGHIFPGLAVAVQLKKRGASVVWLGNEGGMETRIVPRYDIPMKTITISGWRGKGIGTMLKAPAQLIKAVYQSYRILREFKPSVVFGFGGFVSGPGGFAAFLQRVPLFIHEQNAKVGMTNRFLSKLSKRVFQAFPDTFPMSAQAKTVGNPVRLELETLREAHPKREPSNPLHLLVIGGSLGADVFNKLLPEALSMLPKDKPIRVWHQTGERHLASTKVQYAKWGVEAELCDFLNDMPRAYAWADVVLCRAGALTVSELCAVGLGAIFVPYPFAVDDHQTANAAFMVKYGAASCIQQRDLTALRLKDELQQLIASPERTLAMGAIAYTLRDQEAADHFIDLAEETLP